MILRINERNVGFGKGSGQVLALMDGVSVEIDVNVTLGNVPGSVVFLNCRCLSCIGKLTVNGLCTEAAVILIYLIGTVEGAVSRGLRGTGIERSVRIGIHGSIFQIIILIVLSGGVEITVGVHGTVAGGILVIPLIGIEIDGSVCIHVMQITEIFVRHDFLYVKGIDCIIQSNFINKTDGILCTRYGQVGKTAVLFQCYVIGDGRDEGGGNGECYKFFAGRDFLTHLNGGIHHIRFAHAVAGIHRAEIAVGTNDILCVCLDIVGNSSVSFVPEAEELTCRIGIPTDVVGEVILIGVAELTVLISKANQCRCNLIALKTKLFANRCNHFHTQGGRIIVGSQKPAARNIVGSEVCTGEQLIIDKDTLDVGHFHILTDLIYKGDITGKLFALGNKGGIITGLKLDSTDDIVECLSKLVCKVAGGTAGFKILIYIVPIQRSVDYGNRFCRLAASTALHSNGGCAGRIIGFPEVSQRGRSIGIVGIQNTDSNGVAVA